jgi:hypothetical protein
MPPSYNTTPGTTLRCFWEVTAGVIPGHPMPELSKSWTITEEYVQTIREMDELTQEQWMEHFPEGTKLFQFQQDALEYARSLTDPSKVNWVKVEWVWV